MDERIAQHAEIIADHSTTISAGDHVIIEAEPGADRLVEALAASLGQREATMTLLRKQPTAVRSYLAAGDPSVLTTPSCLEAAFEAANASINILGATNDRELADIPTQSIRTYRQVMEPVTENRFASKWLTTMCPTPAAAQNAGMSTRAYENFVWDAILIDWIEQRDYQQQLVTLLEAADEFHLQAEGTDIRMRIDDMPVMNDHGQHNLPGGEVSTAPIVTSPEGTILFDIPLVHDSRTIREARLTLEAGEVVAAEATTNEAALLDLLDTDVGARRLGELGIGMNRSIDRYTNVVLFDEKIHQTVHLAVGRAYRQIVAPGRERNQSAIHVDMIRTLDGNATIHLDGEAVYEDQSYSFD